MQTRLNVAGDAKVLALRVRPSLDGSVLLTTDDNFIRLHFPPNLFGMQVEPGQHLIVTVGLVRVLIEEDDGMGHMLPGMGGTQ